MPDDKIDQLRMAALRRYDILDTPPEEAYDRLTRIVAAALRVPIAAFSLIDDRRQWFKARIGLTESETARNTSFCAHTMMSAEAMVVRDATKDVRFNNNPMVIDHPNIRFYVGYPVFNEEGMPLGALCAIDTKPRNVSALELGLLKDLAALVTEQLELRRLASVDGLTGLLQRKPFLASAQRELNLPGRSKAPNSALMIDADHFKAINDDHGHDVGDHVLKTLADTLKSGLRFADILGRLGGEEFGVLLPDTDLAGAVDVADRLRDLVAELKIKSPTGAVPVTISIGAAQGITGEDIASLLHRADSALLKAKRSGRNKTVAALSDRFSHTHYG